MVEPFYYLSFYDRVPRDAVHVIIGGSVKFLAPGTFEGYPNLARVELQEGVEEIGRLAFARCPNLTRVDCPSSLRTIHEEVFAECRRLSDLILRKGIQRIGAGAFLGCALKRIAVPSSVMEIGGEAFAVCRNLEAVILAGGAVMVASDAFFRCPRLERILILSMAIVVDAWQNGGGTDSGGSVWTAEVTGGIERDPANETARFILGSLEPARLILTSRYLALMSQEDRMKLTDSMDEFIHDQTQGEGSLNLEDAGVAHQIRLCFANCLAEYKAGVAAILELALWKANMNQRSCAAGKGETARANAPTRDDFRRTCGADVVVGPVLSYLWGPHRRADQEENGGSIRL